MPGQDTLVHAIFKGSAIESTSYSGGVELLERMPLHQPTWYFIFLFLLDRTFCLDQALLWQHINSNRTGLDKFSGSKPDV